MEELHLAWTWLCSALPQMLLILMSHTLQREAYTAGWVVAVRGTVIAAW